MNFVTSFSNHVHFICSSSHAVFELELSSVLTTFVTIQLGSNFTGLAHYHMRLINKTDFASFIRRFSVIMELTLRKMWAQSRICHAMS